jgi:hypothetical protein
MFDLAIDRKLRALAIWVNGVRAYAEMNFAPKPASELGKAECGGRCCLI